MGWRTDPRLARLAAKARLTLHPSDRARLERQPLDSIRVKAILQLDEAETVAEAAKRLDSLASRCDGFGLPYWTGQAEEYREAAAFLRACA